MDKVELCGVHADLHKPSAFKDVVKIYADAGVSIVSFGVETFTGDPSERDFFECAALAGAKHISVHFKVDSFPSAVEKDAEALRRVRHPRRHPLPRRLSIRRPARRARIT
ncbi:MAG: hypothetical protein WDO13_07450 [Verrucomicrobiota bacterium]